MEMFKNFFQIFDFLHILKIFMNNILNSEKSLSPLMMGKKDSLFISGSFYFLKIQKQEKKFHLCLIKEQYIENIQLTGYRESLNQGGVFCF